MTLPDLPPLPPPAEAAPARLLIARRRRRHLHAGRVRLTLLALRRHPGWLVFGGLFFLLGSTFAIAPWAMLARDSRIEREGVEAVATVTRHETTTDADGSAERRIHYAFSLPDGTIKEDQEAVTLEGSRSLALGDSIRVLYDPARPSDSFPLGNGEGIDGGVRSVGAAVLFSGIGALFAGFGSLFLWGLLVRGPGMWHRLLQHGREAEGRVVEVEPNDESSTARLHYAFPDRFGREHAGTTEWVPREICDGWTPGDPGIVCYGRQDAGESIWLGRGSLSFFR